MTEGKEGEDLPVQNNNYPVMPLVIPSLVAQHSKGGVNNNNNGDTRHHCICHLLHILTRGKALQMLYDKTTANNACGGDPRIRMAKHKLRNLGKELCEFNAANHSSRIRWRIVLT